VKKGVDVLAALSYPVSFRVRSDVAHSECVQMWRTQKLQPEVSDPATDGDTADMHEQIFRRRILVRASDAALRMLCVEE